MDITYPGKNSFNRTTVECKVFYFLFVFLKYQAFNRTTVECKGAPPGPDWLWNAAFNRTTVECKVFN